MKYEMTDITRTVKLNDREVTVYRIRATEDFTVEAWNGLRVFPKEIHAGDLGGFIEHERNLSQTGSCWVSGKAVVLDEASVSEDAYVSGWPRCLIADHAKVYGKAKVCVASQVRDCAEVSGEAWLYGATTVKDHVKIKDSAHICSTTIGGEVVVCDEAYIDNYRPAISGNDIIGGKTRLLFSALEEWGLDEKGLMETPWEKLFPKTASAM